MKYNEQIIFNEDIISKNNYGLYLIKDTEYTREIIENEIIEKSSYLATVCVKLIWNQHQELKDKRWGFCDFLTDGWCHFIGNKEELIDHLNSSTTKYRILTKEELYFIIDNRSNPNQLFYNKNE